MEYCREGAIEREREKRENCKQAQGLTIQAFTQCTHPEYLMKETLGTTIQHQIQQATDQIIPKIITRQPTKSSLRGEYVPTSH